MGKFEAPKQKKKTGKLTVILIVLLAAVIFAGTAVLVFGKMDQSLSGFSRFASLFSGASKEIKKETHGIDVARYQGTIDWKETADAGVEFAMIRLGARTLVDGEIVEDPNARYNLQEASRNGILVGGYFFSTAITPEEAKEEAAWVADLLSQYPITYPVAYNCEGFLDPENRHAHLTVQQRTQIALAFLDAIEEFGYEGMFYASRNDMEKDVHWQASRIAENYKVWVAQYPEVPYPDTESSSYTGRHQMWQYTPLGSVPGISQNVDIDVAYFGYTKAKKPIDPTPPQEVGPDIEALMYFKPVQETVTAKQETNLRNLPSQGTESIVLYTLKNGETAERIGISDAGWSKLRYENKIFYAVSNFLTTDLDARPGEIDDDGIQTVFTDVDGEEVTAKDTVNLRSIPSVKDPESIVIGQLKNGETAQRTGISTNGWSRLEYKGQVCYAVTSYLIGPDGPEAPEDEADPSVIRTKFEEINDSVTPKDAVNLRTRPTVTEGESEVVVKLKHGQVVPRTGINRDLGWSRVVYEGRELYCITAYLEEEVTP